MLTKQPKPRDPKIQREWDQALAQEEQDWLTHWWFNAPGVKADDRRSSGSSYPLPSIEPLV